MSETYIHRYIGVPLSKGRGSEPRLACDLFYMRHWQQTFCHRYLVLTSEMGDARLAVGGQVPTAPYYIHAMGDHIIHHAIFVSHAGMYQPLGVGILLFLLS